MTLCRAAALAAILLVSVCAGASSSAEPSVWQPSPGHTQILIWPGAAPDESPVPGPETSSQGGVTNVTRPTITLYAPKGANTGAAVVVIPGGGFQMLAIDLEGTEVCDWLTSKGVTCVLLKYRVPSAPYVWRCDVVPTTGQYQHRPYRTPSEP